jgi:hypothetical protein
VNHSLIPHSTGQSSISLQLLRINPENQNPENQNPDKSESG